MVTVRLRLDRDEWSVEWMKEWVDRRSTQQRWTRRVKLSLHYVLLSRVVTLSWDVHRSSAGGFDTIRSRIRILILVLVEVNFVVFRGDDDRLRGSLQRHVEALRVLCTTLERIHKALAGWALHRPHFRFNNVRLVFLSINKYSTVKNSMQDLLTNWCSRNSSIGAKPHENERKRWGYKWQTDSHYRNKQVERDTYEYAECIYVQLIATTSSTVRVMVGVSTGGQFYIRHTRADQTSYNLSRLRRSDIQYSTWVHILDTWMWGTERI